MRHGLINANVTLASFNWHLILRFVQVIVLVLEEGSTVMRESVDRWIRLGKLQSK